MINNPWGNDQPALPLPPSRRESDQEKRRLRIMLAHCILHAEQAHADRIAAITILADDPTIGIDHPAVAKIANPTANGWVMRKDLVEMAIARKLFPGETQRDALLELRRIIESGWEG